MCPFMSVGVLVRLSMGDSRRTSMLGASVAGLLADDGLDRVSGVLVHTDEGDGQ